MAFLIGDVSRRRDALRWLTLVVLGVVALGCDGPEIPAESAFSQGGGDNDTTDASTLDTDGDDASQPDIGESDTQTVQDSALEDTTLEDTVKQDASDTNTPDTATLDAAQPDTNSADTTSVDTTANDSAATDSDSPDAVEDGGADVGTATDTSATGCAAASAANGDVCDLPGAATGVCHDKTCIVVPAGMKYVPATTYTRGCVSGDTNCEADESPAHQVTLKAFFVDTYEVTNARYGACVTAGNCTAPEKPCGTSGWSYSTWNEPGNAQLPVTCVDWQKANSFCANTIAGGRLPTEAEFERLLRAKGNGLVYPWGNAFPPPDFTGNYADQTANTANGWAHIQNYNDGYAGPAPVGSFKADALGLFDVSGNVWEWTSDWYSAQAYALTTASQGIGPTSGTNRIMRGGGFFWTNWSWRSSRRLNFAPGFENQDLGLRCAKSID